MRGWDVVNQKTGETHPFPTRREAHAYSELLQEDGETAYVIAWPDDEDADADE